MTLDEIKRINDRRLAKHGQKYYTDDKVYIGNPDGTLSIYVSVPAQFNPTAGTGIDISGQYPNQTITNTAPDQIVDLIAGTNISITGTYPDFTINSTSIASTPGGVDSNVQYNNSGAFGGDSTFTFNDTTKVVGVDALAFSLTPVNAPGNGQIAYVGNTGALAYNLNNSSVTSQIGQTLHAYVHNAEGVQINKGEAVYLYQASGNKASVKLAYNTSDSTSAKTFGLAAENIGAGQNGMVICQGVLDGLNLGTYNEGDTLYLDSIAGGYTSTKPYAPNHLVYIGVVERANNGNGQIYVKVQNGYEMDEIHDVQSLGAVNNDILYRDTTVTPNLWKPAQISTILGYTPYNATNPAGYIDATALTPYLTTATAAATYQSLLTYLIFVETLADLPASVAGVITLTDNTTYFFTTVIDLLGDRIVAGINTTIVGGSSENCRIKSTGLVGTALITSNYSLPMRNITIEADVALNLDGDATTTIIDWFGVNFTDCNTVGLIKDYTNVIMADSAFLNSGGLTFDGTIGTIGFSQSLFNCNPGNSVFILPSTLIVTRRFRVIYSSFVVLAGEIGINADVTATIPNDGYILDTVNFSGGGTYLNGVIYTDNKALFVNNVGITNTSNVGHYRTDANTTVTTISASNTWFLAQGTTTAAYGNSPKFVHTNQRLTYVGSTTQDFYASGSITIEGAANNQTYGITIGVNGVPSDPDAIEVRAATSGQPYSSIGLGIVPLSTGDYIELFVKNLNTAQNVTVTEFNIIVQKLAG